MVLFLKQTRESPGMGGCSPYNLPRTELGAKQMFVQVAKYFGREDGGIISHFPLSLVQRIMQSLLG